MSIEDLEANLDVLELLSTALVIPQSLDEGLNQVVRMTCRLMETEQAVFLQLDEEHNCFIVRAVAGVDSPAVRLGCPLQVPERLQNILLKLQHQHAINWVDSGIDGLIFPIIAMPIHFKGKRLGHLLTGGSRDLPKTKEPARRKMLSLLAPFISLVIENAKANDLLSQRFAMYSRELLDQMQKEADDKEGRASETLMVNSVNNPLKVVRLLAESFHRQLTQAGFTPGQATVAAAHIVSCVNRQVCDCSGKDVPVGRDHKE